MREVKLFAVGDILLRTRNGRPPFEGVASALAEKDVLFGNLETVLSCAGQEAEKASVLFTDPEEARYLAEAGFDVLNVANNHILDRGTEGLAATLDVLEQQGLTYIGAGRSGSCADPRGGVVIERNGLRIGFLGYASSGKGDVGNGLFVRQVETCAILEDMRYTRSACDVIVVSLHWGLDDLRYPPPEHIALAHTLVEHGACVVLGHHAHVLQGIEEYKGGLIAYCLGNFQFKCDRSERHRQSLILSVRLTEDGMGSYDIIPADIDDDLVPHVLADGHDRVACLAALTAPIIEGRITRSWWFEHVAGEYLSNSLAAWRTRIRRYGFRHLVQCLAWTVSPFALRCYLGLLVRAVRRGPG